MIGPRMLSFLLGPSIASAQIIGNIPGCQDYTNGLLNGFISGRITSACIPMFLANVIVWIFGVIGIFFTLNLMFAGYEIAFGGLSGDKEAGKNRFKWSLIGFAIAACAFLILDLVLSTIA